MTLLKNKPLPLMDIAARGLVANLFKESSVLLSISNFHSKYSPYYYDWDESILQVWEETVQVKLSDEISKLGLPKKLLSKLNDIVGQMGWLVRDWKEFHEEYLHDSLGEALYFDVPVLLKLRWTTAGVVDYRETAVELICSDVLDIVKKFKLACLYCLEDYIPIFWKELPKENKRYFYSKAGSLLQNGGLGQEFWWPYFIQGQEYKLNGLTRSYRRRGVTFYQYAFQCSVHKGNKTAAVHFLQKLTNKEKEVSLMSAIKAFREQYFRPNGSYMVFPLDKFYEVLCYLLSAMTPDQQVRILQEMPRDVLNWFLVWPLQDMFLEIADNIWNILPDRGRDDVLFFMYENSENFGDDSLKLFQEFFLRISPDFWISFVDRQSASGSIFGSFLYYQDIKPLEICFRSLDASARKRLIFSEAAINALKKHISENKLDVVEVCIREAGLSQEDRMVLKETLQIGMKLKTRKWSGNGLVHLLDETNINVKRCFNARGETATEAKKKRKI